MKRCPFFGKCGGCKYDFTAPDYHEQKIKEITNAPLTDDAVWVAPGLRRRADFCFAAGEFGFFERGTKNIIPVRECPNLTPGLNSILPIIADLPWCGAGACLITECNNGIDVSISANVPYFTPEFRDAIMKTPIIRATWNDKTIKQTAVPQISFGEHVVEYPSNTFLQPSIAGADALRKMVTDAASGFNRIADLFCGLGNFTFALNADGFDIVGTGAKRDLFKKPMTVGMLNQYDCIVMDPPRAGAMAQCNEIIKSNVKRVIYVSCNPQTFVRDMKILERGGYRMTKLIPVDQFAGSQHWELFGIFEK